jgi:para-aminobenzoate synthetase component 1
MEPCFWMGGRLATGLERISHDISSLREPGFWAVVGTFENSWTLAKFRDVYEMPLPKLETEWQGIQLSSWESSHDKRAYKLYVEGIKESISKGDVYQVNACRTLKARDPANRTLLPLAHRIQENNPAPFASYLSLPELEIASASPERFVELKNGMVLSSPIKGTSATEEFLEKDHAENLMIVDLIRNDIGRVARVGSISTPRLLSTEPHPGLFHLVSDVRAELDERFDVVDLLQSMMPPGSVSGAPKSSALKIIAENEGARGPYCGAIGWVEDGRAELAVGIRTFWQGFDSYLRFGTGAGITWGSDPELEWEETELKAHRLIGLTQT